MRLSIKNVKSNLKNYWQEIILSLGFIFYNLYFITASFLRYVNYYTGRFDLGNMDQTVWNTLHGNIFMLTDPNGTEQISRLAVHADFILIFLSPLYLVCEDPRMLLLVQTLILSIGGIFIYLISKNVLKNKTISLIFALCFFLNPAVQFTNLFDFHAVVLATTFLLGAFYFILIKKWWLVLVFLFLAGLTKEQVWAINAIFGLYLIFISKQKVIGIFVTIFSAIAFYSLFWIAIPAASAGDQHFALSFFANYGNTPGEVIKNIIFNPIQVIGDLTTENKITYIKQLLQPLGFTSLIGFPFLIFALPDLAINLLSDFGPMQRIWYQYTATITPFIFIASIYGVSFINRKVPKVKLNYLSILLLLFTLFSAYSYGPMFFSKDPNDSWYKKPLENKEIVNEYINKIPADINVAASNNLASHLSYRKGIFVVPSGIEKADLVLLMYPNPNDREKEIFESVKSNSDFKLDFNDQSFYVFKRVE